MIRHAKREDLECLLPIYENAKKFMHENGNPTQWAGAYPAREDLESDIERNILYVVESDAVPGKIIGATAITETPDPTYAIIKDGAWLSDTPYATVHRTASAFSENGIIKKIMDFVKEKHDHIRIDTHRDNIPMQKAVLAEGFTKQGTIFTHDGSPRWVYEWVK